MGNWKYTGALLDAVTANTTGEVFNVDGYSQLKIYVLAASVSTGATISVKEQSPNGDWHEVYSLAVTASGAQDVIYLPGPFDNVRVDVEDYTDGTYTATAQAV